MYSKMQAPVSFAWMKCFPSTCHAVLYSHISTHSIPSSQKHLSLHLVFLMQVRFHLSFIFQLKYPLFYEALSVLPSLSSTLSTGKNNLSFLCVPISWYICLYVIMTNICSHICFLKGLLAHPRHKARYNF